MSPTGQREREREGVILQPLDYVREFNRPVDTSAFTFYFYPGDGRVQLRCADVLMESRVSNVCFYIIPSRLIYTRINMRKYMRAYLSCVCVRARAR